MAPVTTNPILIAVINMTVVFAVLYGLSLMIQLITIIDPTKKKQIDPSRETVKATLEVSNATSQTEDYNEMIILFTAAIAAYGHGGVKIVAIRPVGASTWSQTARMEGVSLRNAMF